MTDHWNQWILKTKSRVLKTETLACWTKAAKAVALSLTLDAEDETAEELAKLYGRQSSKISLDPKACGDLGPVLSKALALAALALEKIGSVKPLECLCNIEVEMNPVAVGAEIELVARTEGDGQSVLVTGWLKDKDVLRFRADFKASE